MNATPSPNQYTTEQVAGNLTGVVLAGGRARRMGGEDKGLVTLGGQPMVSHVIERMRPQVHTLVISANRNLERYEEISNCAVIADAVGDFGGPLAGMAAAMDAATTLFLLTAPCDSPLLIDDIAVRLYTQLAKDNAEISVAHDGERMQPVFALISCNLFGSLMDYLESGQAKIDRWYETRRLTCTDLSDQSDMFLNLNTPEDRGMLEEKLGEIVNEA